VLLAGGAFSLAVLLVLRVQVAARKTRRATRRTIFKRAESYVKVSGTHTLTDGATMCALPADGARASRGDSEGRRAIGAQGDTRVQSKVTAARYAQLLADPNLSLDLRAPDGAEQKGTVTQ
jgi:hypothetical protein